MASQRLRARGAELVPPDRVRSPRRFIFFPNNLNSIRAKWGTGENKPLSIYTYRRIYRDMSDTQHTPSETSEPMKIYIRETTEWDIDESCTIEELEAQQDVYLRILEQDIRAEWTDAEVDIDWDYSIASSSTVMVEPHNRHAEDRIQTLREQAMDRCW